MAFNNLSEKFEQSIEELYARGSLRDKADGTQTDEPIIETSIPRNPGEYRNYGDDTRSVPLNSVATDLDRMTKWSTSTKGLQWYLNESILQTGNAFGITRIFNPIFVVGNTQPFIHIKRPLADASDDEVVGDVSQRATMDSIGSAGRLHTETSKFAIAKLLGKQNNLVNSIISSLPPFKLVQVIGGLYNISNTGILGVNQRPELDIGNSGTYTDYYSVALWQGFQKSDGPIDYLGRAGANLRRGNIPGAVRSLGKFVTEVGQETGQLLNLLGVDNRLASANDTVTGGRYFITGPDTADRYYPESMMDGQPTNTVNRNPILYIHGDAAVQSELTLDNILSNYQNISLNNPVQKASSYNIASIITDSAQNPTFVSTDNSVENKLLYPELSLQQRYLSTDDRALFIRTALPNQKSYWKSSRPTVIDGPAGYGGGVNLNEDVLDAGVGSKYRLIVSERDGRRRYFFDKMNASNMGPSSAPFGQSLKGDADLRSTVIDQYRKQAPGLIDMFFFDFVNGVAIPFRAYITGLSENVQPEYRDNFYIGRTERNVQYMGAKRNLTFSLFVHASNEEELITIWRKINYLTGLCFPSNYSNGYMVAPLVKLTLGDVYNNQPGYISSLNTVVEDDVPWEITPGIQVPHGVRITVNYNIIEKAQMQTNDFIPGELNEFTPFYSFGQPRTEIIRPIDTSTTGDSSPIGTSLGGTAGAGRGTGRQLDLDAERRSLTNTAVNSLQDKKFLNKLLNK